MNRLILPIADYVRRKPRRIPVIVSSAAIISSALLTSLLVAMDLHQNGAILISVVTALSACLAVPAGIVHYMREDHIARQQAELLALASTDALTGIMNRRTFELSVERERARMRRTGGQAALILLDIDWFKSINDTFGHAAGDTVLKTVAELAAAALRQPLDVIARWGGEEFAILLTGVTQEQALEVSERLRRSIEKAAFDTVAPGLSVSASFGLCPMTAGCSLRTALNEADAALYRAKKNGRNQTVCAAGAAKPMRVIAKAG